MRYFAICSYEGWPFNGWQTQSDKKSIQDKIEQVLSKLLSEPITIFGSGRTDAGVHALGQTFHFDTLKKVTLKSLKLSMNALLKPHIHIFKLKKVHPEFHARLSAKQKMYRYVINNQTYNPFLNGFSLYVSQPLDLQAMKEAAKLFVGTHDFSSFTSKQEDFKKFIRTIESIKIYKYQKLINIDLVGDGFMMYMVRMIVATLILIGSRKEDKSYILRRLDKQPRQITHYKAEPHGLYLSKVFY